MKPFAMHPISITCVAALILASGCTSSQRWSSEEPLALPDAFVETPPSGLDLQDSLLSIFQSPELDKLVATALTQNPDLQLAGARMQEAGFNLQQVRSFQAPRVDLGATALRSDNPSSSPANTFAADLDASWEVDIWGGVRASVKASRADYLSAEAQLDAARQSLVGQVMQAWFNLLAATEILDLDQRRVESFSSTESLVSRRFDLGETTLSALSLAQTDLANAKADLESSRNLRKQAIRRLQALLGDYPSGQLDLEMAWPTPVGPLAAGIPSDLLMNRPDVVSAFAQVKAADARLQVSQAELFPTFRLTASGGRAGPELSDLADSAFNSWSVLANLAVNLFDLGAERSAIKAANKRAEQAYYNYQSVVLNALRETENAIGSEQYLAREESSRLVALEAAESTLQRVRREYETGLSNILTLLETQRRVFFTERQTINIKAARLNNRVSLALALGKGA